MDKRRLEAFLVGASTMAGADHHWNHREGTGFPSLWADHWDEVMSQWSPDCRPAFRAGGHAGHAGMSIAEAFASAMEFLGQKPNDGLLARFLAAINDRREDMARKYRPEKLDYMKNNPITSDDLVRYLRSDHIRWGLEAL